MPGRDTRHELHVEGVDDYNSIRNLVKQHGIDFDKDPSAPTISQAGSVERLLDEIDTAIPLNGGRIIGFVLDADDRLAYRWASVRQRLINSGVLNLPPDPPEGGFIGESPKYKARVGVWLMPDNQRPGALELFLQDLVPAGNLVFEHARSATERAEELGAGFREVDRLKATLHAWLAWQESPGLPYGMAITTKYFEHVHPVARLFVNWYSALYRLAPVA